MILPTIRLNWCQAIGGLLLLSSFLFTACGPRERAVDRGVKEQVLHFANAEPQTLDPHVMSGVPERLVVENLFEGLVAQDPETLEPIPGSAERWDVSEDGKTYTFYIREGLKWSNGDPLNAHDFHYGMKRVLSPLLATPYIQQFKGIKNAIAYNEGQITDFSEVGVRVIDDLTIQFEMDAPNPVILFYMDYPIFYPVHQENIEKFGNIDQRGTEWFRAGNMVGNGPFILKEWVTNTHILLEPNPHYWDRDAVKLKQAYFYPIESFETAYRAYQNGQVHVAPSLPQHVIMELEKERPGDYRRGLYLGTYHYIFNNERPPLDNPKVRLALSMAIDRENIVNRVAQGGQQPAYSFIPPGANNYKPDYTFEENIEEAKRLLAEAGYPNGEGFPVLRILFNSQENHRKIAEAVQQMWKNSLNIDIELENMEWKVYLDATDQGNFDIARQGWVGGVDYGSYLDLFSAKGGNNHSKWANAEFDELYFKSLETMDPDLRLKITHQAEELMLKQMPTAPIYHYTYNYVVDERVKNWYDNAIDQRRLKTVYLEE